VLCGGLLREASSSSVNEGLPTWNLTAASAPKNLVCVTGGTRSLSLRSRRGARRVFRVRALYPRNPSPCPRNAHARKQESKDARSGPRGDPQVGMGVEFLGIDPDSNATLQAWIENLRAVTCRHIGKLYHMTEEVPPQKGDTAAVMRFDRCTIRISPSMTYPAVFQVHTSVRLPPVRRDSYLFRRTKAQTFGCDAPRFYTMKRIDTNCDVHGLERYHG
jgi:hypothetical protein